MEHKLSTRAMTESALMVGLAAIFALLSMVPLVGALAILISGIPITITTARNGSFAGGLSAILATILIALFLGPLSAVSYGLENMLVGFVVGFMLNKRKSGSKILFATTVTAAFASLAVMLVSLMVMGFGAESIAAYYAQMESEMMAIYKDSGILDMLIAQGQVGTAEITAMLQSMIALAVKLSPSLMMIMGALNGILIYWLSIIILKRLKIRVPRSSSITNWQLPFSTVWFLIAIWALWLFGDRIPFEWVNVVVLNCAVLCAALMFVNGLAAAAHVFHWSEMSKGMKAVSILASFMFITGFVLGFIIFGIMDLLFDFRKKKADNSR